MKVYYSIIVPFIKSNKYLNILISELEKLALKKNNFELILVSENRFNCSKKKKYPIKIIQTKSKKPGEKRNAGARQAKGNILIFLDDDSYPLKNYFFELNKLNKKILRNYKTVFGGSGICPENESNFGKTSSLSYEARFFNPFFFRYVRSISNNNKLINDWPSVNLVISKKFFFEIGGYDEQYWPGEDSKLCEIIIKNKGTIYYSSNLTVYHFRRSSLKKHLKQIFNYSFHRGLFFKQKDKNSLSIIYLIPTIFTLYLFLLIISLKVYGNSFFLIPFYLFLFLMGFEATNIAFKKKFLYIVPALILIFINQLVYGFGFLKGLIGKKNYKINLSG